MIKNKNIENKGGVKPAESKKAKKRVFICLVDFIGVKRAYKRGEKISLKDFNALNDLNKNYFRGVQL